MMRNLLGSTDPMETWWVHVTRGRYGSLCDGGEYVGVQSWDA